MVGIIRLILWFSFFFGIPILIVSCWFVWMEWIEKYLDSKKMGIILILSVVLGYILLIFWVFLCDELRIMYDRKLIQILTNLFT
jgi:asparagine N-glycosylation enzyme membrane subunit Stt3